jgi:hypothetical protein
VNEAKMYVEFKALHINEGIVKYMCHNNALKIQKNAGQGLEFEIDHFQRAETLKSREQLSLIAEIERRVSVFLETFFFQKWNKNSPEQ